MDKIGSFVNDRDTSDSYWLVTTEKVKSDYYNYSHSGEMFTYNELTELSDVFAMYLNSRLKSITRLEFTEPNYAFELHPKGKSAETDVIFYINEIALANYFAVYLLRDDIIVWRDYLNEMIEKFVI